MKKLGGLVAFCGALALAGCAAPSPVPEPSETPEAAIDFCDVLDQEAEAFDAAVISRPVDASALARFAPWAELLEESAPENMAKDVAAYTSPIRIGEGADPDGERFDWTMAHNDIIQHCRLD